jgi:hypothetical protein
VAEFLCEIERRAKTVFVRRIALSLLGHDGPNFLVLLHLLRRNDGACHG